MATCASVARYWVPSSFLYSASGLISHRAAYTPLPAPPSAIMAEVAELKKKKVAELKEELSQRGLDTKGIKDELVSRLAEAIAAEQQGEEEAAVEEAEEPVKAGATDDAETAAAEVCTLPGRVCVPVGSFLRPPTPTSSALCTGWQTVWAAVCLQPTAEPEEANGEAAAAAAPPAESAEPAAAAPAGDAAGQDPAGAAPVAPAAPAGISQGEKMKQRAARFGLPIPVTQQVCGQPAAPASSSHVEAAAAWPSWSCSPALMC